MKFFAITGGKWWGFEGTTDYRSMDKVRDTMNAAVAGSARYTQYVGGHCCWNTWYNPAWTEAGDNIYTWMLKQSKAAQTANQAPVANAGNDQTITLPLNTITLNGSGSDPDGTISSYQWNKIAGPASFNISSATAAQTAVLSLVQGTYQFELTVTDNLGASDKDTINISVLPLSGLPGSANAGPDTVIYLNQTRPDTALLNGSGSTGASSYLWTRISGPGSPVIQSPAAAVSYVTGLQEGTYRFQLTTNAAFFDTMTVVVRDFMKKNIRPCRTGAPQAFTLAKSDANQLYRPYLTRDNTVPGLMGGDTLYIPGGTYTTGVSIGDIGGGPGCPVIIAPKDQPVVITNNGFFSLADRDTAVMCYVRFDGTLLKNKGFPYGWVVDNSTLPSTSVTRIGFVVNWAHHIDISGLYINHAELGLMYKMNAKPLVQGQFDKILLRSVKIHDNYIRRTNAEGMYIGHTGVSGVEGGNSTPYGPPPRMDSVEIYNNIVDSTRLDGIQLSNSLSGCKIYNNLVRNYGVANQSSHRSGILSGANIESIKIFNNFISNGTGSSILAFGFGSTQIYHNITDSVVSGSNTEYGVYLQRNSVYPEVISTLVPFINGNIFKNAEARPVYTAGGGGVSGGIISDNYFIENGSNTVANNSGSTVTNNTIINSFPLELNIVQPNFPAYYLNVTQADSTRSFTDVGAMVDWIFSRLNVPAPANQLPVANAGADQTITLPVSTVTLSGSGTDPDGSITAYQWTKIAGPASFAITASANPGTTVTGLVQGVYRFELTVTDNNGATDKDTVQITVNPAVNQLPVANAGVDQSITLPVNTVTLSGSGTDPDGSITAYQWTKIAGPVSGTISAATSASTSVTSMVQGVYRFELTVTDNSGATDKDTVQVTVNAAVNQPPVANAGADQVVNLPVNSTTLSGSGSDPDGSITAYQWTKIAGPASGSITAASSASTGVTGLAQGVYRFELTVTDNSGATDKDTVQVTVNAYVNQAPVANAGADQVVTLPVNTVTLNGSGSDPDGSISAYQWIKVAGPVSGSITAASNASTGVTALVQGVYRFELTVTDNSGATDKDTVQVTVNAAVNQPPVANAGADQVINLPVNSTTLSGSGSDPDGSISAYQWTKIAGPASGTITSPAAASTSITSLVQGVYRFELTVTDNSGATDKDTVQVTVNAYVNQPPVANAGADQVINLPVNSTTLNGSGSDPDGNIISYNWTKISGPSQYSITASGSASTGITSLVQGIYQFELTVTDNSGATDKDTVQVTVNAAVNQPPVANAGTDLVITLPVNSTTLSGSGSDPDGSITAYQWTKIAGPASGSITAASSASTGVTGLTQGVYRFELTVTDNSGATDKDTVQVTVNSLTNQAPVANAGADIVISLPVNSATLNGSGSDPDGNITAYQWTKIAGPVAGSISSPASASTGLTGLVQGVYQFELTVTDNNGVTDADTVQVTVNAAINQLPVANAGNDQVINLPVNSTTLSGSGSDPDGSIVAWQWIKISGPAQFNITAGTSASTGIVNLVQGVYRFELTVTDNSGATAKDTVQVTVNAYVNQLPVANAGADITITLPVNTVTLNGSGSDPDGTIISYNWTKISGPSQYSITASGNASTGVTALVQGVYQFELTVTDNSGATAKDTVQVTVNASVNQGPVANAGADQVINLPVNSTTLNGSGSDPDGSITAYQWTKISGPAQFNITAASSASTGIVNLVQGVYRFELTVTDNSGATAKDTVQVTVNAYVNQLPLANAGNDLVITLPVNSVTLNGTGSDPDGSIVAYLWNKISGPAQYTITSSGSASTGVTGLTEGLYQFELIVTDNSGATDRDTMQVTVNPAPNQLPVADAGADRVIVLPVNSLTLTGSGMDPDGTIVSYQWSKVAGPAQFVVLSPLSAQTFVNNLVQGVYLFELTVTDNSGATDKDTVQVTVNPFVNLAPTAYAGADIVITLPVNSVTLNGSGSDADGTIASYRWTKVSGPSQYSITNTANASTGATGLVQGVYQFELMVTDNYGATGTDTVQVTVNSAVNQAPVAHAGNDITITLPVNSTTLNGTGSDPDGTITSYRWTKLTGPAQYSISAATSASTGVTGLVNGIYQFELTVTDNSGATAKDTVQVTVNAIPNNAPVANAGADQQITLPLNKVTLTGTATDSDGTIAGYRWTRISGPVSYQIDSALSARTQVQNLEEGDYLFELLVTDNLGATDRDTVKVTVLPAPAASRLAIYPNPAVNELIIELNTVTFQNKTPVRIYDMAGTMVYQTEVMRNQPQMILRVDVSKFPRGSYIVQVGLDINRNGVMKFVKH
ncbi:MAG: tandem-95 repeat protein [Chitinophagaceae bacterium]|nr:tandem-95 repeat protein [Chitinophagaceae bacterium]